MIVCDMCPDRTPAAFRYTMESLDPEHPHVPEEDPFGFLGVVEAMGLMPRARFRSAVALCTDHATQISSDPEVARALLFDAIKANRQNDL